MSTTPPQPAKLVLACAGCTIWLKVGAEYAGKTVRCPQCKAMTPIPEIPPPSDVPLPHAELATSIAPEPIPSEPPES